MLTKKDMKNIEYYYVHLITRNFQLNNNIPDRKITKIPLIVFDQYVCNKSDHDVNVRLTHFLQSNWCNFSHQLLFSEL